MQAHFERRLHTAEIAELRLARAVSQVSAQIFCSNVPGFIAWRQARRQLASLTGQCRQVYCLVEMAPSAPSWRPPHQRGEFDGFPGRREGPNQCRHTRSFQAFSTYPVLRRSRRRRIAPSDPSLNQPSRQSPAACPEWPNSSRTFTNLNNSLNREPNE